MKQSLVFVVVEASLWSKSWVAQWTGYTPSSFLISSSLISCAVLPACGHQLSWEDEYQLVVSSSWKSGTVSVLVHVSILDLTEGETHFTLPSNCEVQPSETESTVMRITVITLGNERGGSWPSPLSWGWARVWIRNHLHLLMTAISAGKASIQFPEFVPKWELDISLSRSLNPPVKV